MKAVIKAAIIGAVALGMSATTSFAGNKKGHSPKPTICFIAKPHYSGGHSSAHRSSYGKDHRASRNNGYRSSHHGHQQKPSRGHDHRSSNGNGHRR